MTETAAAIVSSTLPTLAKPRFEQNGHAAGSRDPLQQAIDHAAELLPSQGPIGVFIHHNTLHAFEDLPFDDGVRAGAELFGCEPYLPEDRYREKFQQGKIRAEDLVAELKADLGPRADERILMFGSRFDLHLAMLRFPLHQATGDELRWLMAETDALRKFREEAPFAVKHRTIQETRHWVQSLSAERSALQAVSQLDATGVISELLDEHSGRKPDRWDDAEWEHFTLEALWRTCRHGVHADPTPRPKRPPPLRHRDALLQAVGHDSDLLVHEVLIRFCAAYLDQGLAPWGLLRRDQGFAAAFANLYRDAHRLPERWRDGVSERAKRLGAADFDPLTSIAESLHRLGVAEAEWQAYLTATLLALRGWAGMIRQIEARGDRVVRPIPKGSLVEYLAVRLELECAALDFLAQEHLGHRVPLSELKSACQTRRFKPPRDPQDQRAFVLFQLAQLLGWLPKDLIGLSQADWGLLLHEVETFDALARRRIYHRAFERQYRIQVLDALSFRARLPEKPRPAPTYQVTCCLDEREESFRRHLEEISPETETLSGAGFYNLAIYYQGVADAHYVPLCPFIVRPQHWIREEVAEPENGVHETQTQARWLFGHTLHQLEQGSQTFWGGALITAGLGSLASIPLVARVLFPRLASRLRSSAGKWVIPKHARLRFRRPDDVPPAPHGDGIGFTLDEMVARMEVLLRDFGLTKGFAPLVTLLGHGSSSLNNPHESAHDCGACGGGRGGPNGRLAAKILNQQDVRERLAQRGIPIPDGTVFVGGYHNTCNDEVILYDLDLVPESHAGALASLRRILDEACRRNAHERSRRFFSADPEATFEEALKHVEARTEDLAQVRPEYGHASNAVTFVGRRQRTRGLFMDRRTFLTSYDPDQDDDEATVLTRLLGAVVPVCAGISLEYYFSYIDPAGWGCSTKLPHNVAAMVGVMDGASSDLRPGLPWQMVEIHDPFRSLFVLETPFERLPAIFKNAPALERMARNEWIQLAILDAHSDRILTFERGEFRPYQPESQRMPLAASSWEWYRGWRDHLPFAIID